VTVMVLATFCVIHYIAVASSRFSAAIHSLLSRFPPSCACVLESCCWVLGAFKGRASCFMRPQQRDAAPSLVTQQG
jgi:hypothetical protein